MKTSSFWISIAAVLVALLCGIAWIGSHRLGDTTFGLRNQQKLVLPATAAFIPSNASLTLHSFIDLNNLPVFTDVSASKQNKSGIQKEVKAIRDSFFSFAGLDFGRDLAEWVSDEASFSLLDNKNNSTGWIFLAHIRKERSETFIDNFLASRDLSEDKVMIVNYENYEIIKPLEGNDKYQFSIVDLGNGIVMISSSLEDIKQSIDTSKISHQDSLSTKNMVEVIDQLGDGIALLSVSQSALNKWLGFPLEFTERNDVNGLIGGIKFKGSSLIFEGLIPLESLPDKLASNSYSFEDINSDSKGLVHSFALFSSSINEFDITNRSPFIELIDPLVTQLVPADNSKLFKQITGLNDLPSVWLNEPSGWVVGTQASDEDVSEISSKLVNEGWIQSELSSDKKSVFVWTKLFVNQFIDDLNVELATALEQDGEFSWWGQTLAALQQRRNTKELGINLEAPKELSQSDMNKRYSYVVAFDRSSTLMQLKAWRPWVLLRAFVGTSVNSSLQGLHIALGSYTKGEIVSIHLKAQLRLG